MSAAFAVSSEEAVALLERIVSIPSPSRSEAEASSALVEWMNASGFRAEVDGAGSAVGVRGEGEREILLLGHIDTFPGNPSVRNEDGVLHGRGAVDAKGPLCAFAVAAARVEVPDGWKVTVVGAVEEEAATSKGARHVLQQRLPPRGAPPIVCIIGEPSRWDRITLGYKGRLLFEVELRVPFAHSAGRERLPAERGVDLWSSLVSFCEARSAEARGEFDRLTPSLRAIASADDGSHGRVSLSTGFRLPPGVDPFELETALRSSVAVSARGAEILRCEFSGAEQAWRSSRVSPLVQAFLRSIRREGGEPGFVVKTGTSDMNVVAPSWPATPVVAYGPGDSSLDHTPEERIELEEYLRAVRVLGLTLEHLLTARG
jgi:LysW-gamma-L-lysine carboxypeptidase